VDAYEALITRRSVPKMPLDKVPGRDDVQRLLDAAVRAPNHHLTQPWRFVVLAGTALEEFGAAWARGTDAAGKDASGIMDKAHRAPVIIVVIERPKTHLPKVVEIEEHHAVGAVIQNILLAAHALGLGAMHRTGPGAAMTQVEEYVGIKEGEFIAGFIYVGYPPEGDAERPKSRRTPAEELTEWRGWDH
jgi:nitroreductase